MDQKPDALPDLPTASKPTTSGAAHVDLGKILLPKKPNPVGTVDSAQRINAGALFEQEKNATLVPEKPAPQKTPGQISVPKPPVTVKKEDPVIPPLQTYKGDIESLIQSSNASTVSIAAAEATRRSTQPLNEGAVVGTDWSTVLKRAGMITAGLLLLFSAAGIMYFIYQHLNATVSIPEPSPAPFITVDTTTSLTLPATELQRTTLLNMLEAARQNSKLSLGLIERFAIYQTAVSEDAAPLLLGAESVLPTLAPNMPAELIRALTGTYLLGLHAYDGTQAFLLFEVDSYEHAFAGMLAWERTMRGDLLPLFSREPRPRLIEEGVATSSVGDVPQVIQTGFSDKILENRDTRVILNTAGDVLLMWAPLSQNVFVITTNEYTLRELISRLGL